jgi:hypothetical protein
MAMLLAIGIHFRAKRKVVLSENDLEQFFNGIEDNQNLNDNDPNICSRMPYNKDENEIGRGDFEIGIE